MKNKIILKKEDPKMISLIYDFVKVNKGTIIEYSDKFLIIEKDDILIHLLMRSQLFSNKIEKVI